MEGRPTRKTRKVSIALDDEPLNMKSCTSDPSGSVSGLRSRLEEETEAPEVPIPPDGGWGWVVCLASFMCNLILDGIAYTFGVLFNPLVEEFQSDRASVAWIGSLLCGMYMLSGPIVGGLVNRYGSRPVCVAGGIIAWGAISLSVLSVNVGMMMFLYGIVGGFGLGLIYLPAVVSVGHYFESKRALATGIAVCGSGVGTFLLAPLSSYLVLTYSWKTCNLVLASLFGVCILCGLAMKPLEILPGDTRNIGKLMYDISEQEEEEDTERRGSGISMVANMPRIAENDEVNATAVRSQVNLNRRRTRTISMNPDLCGSKSAVHLKTMRPRMSVISMTLSTHSIEQTLTVPQRTAKPFDRKDIFYSGSMANFDMEGEVVVVRPNRSTFFSIKDGGGGRIMSRNSLVNMDLKDEETVSSVLKSMMDFSLFKEKKFLLVSVSNIFGFLGFYVPFMYLPDLAQSNENITEEQAATVLSVIGISNTIGRLLTGWIADRPWGGRPLVLCTGSLLLSSICVFSFPLLAGYSYTLFIGTAAVFGLFVAAYISLTSILLVDLLGIERLTNAFGLVTMFRGASAILGPPVAGAVFEATESFHYSFIMAAAFFLLAGLLSLAAVFVQCKEEEENDKGRNF